MAAKRSHKKQKSASTKAPLSSKAPARRSKPTTRRRSAAGAGADSAGENRAGDDRIGQLERLIEMMVQKDVVEVELEEGGARWRVRRTEPQAIHYSAAPMAMHAASAAPAGFAPVQAPATGAPEPQGEVFKSPMLGTFYSSPSPDAEPFVKAGDRVAADRTLCIIEAMKVMNEIKAEQEFEVVEVLVKNGEPVEYGQPLFLIR